MVLVRVTVNLKKLVKHKERECANENCEYVGALFAKGLCPNCYRAQSTAKWLKKRQQQTPKERKPVKRTPVKKVSSKRATVLKGDAAFYQEIWKERPHNCVNCSRYLGENLQPHFMSHILSKGAYPQLRWVKENINVLCLGCHNKWEFGVKEKMAIFAINEPVIERLKNLANGNETKL